MHVQRAAALSLAILASGCASRATLAVDLQSDLAPGLEVDRVRIARPEEPGVEPVEVSVADRGSLLAPVRVAELDLPRPSSVVLRVELLRAGAVVASGSRAVQIRSAAHQTTVLVVRPRDDAPDACPAGSSVVGGRCVPDVCSPEVPAECPEPECGSDGDCDASLGACGRGVCLSGTCGVALDDARCPSGRCMPDRTCAPVDIPDAGLDAGSPDGGSPDGGPPDAGPPPPGLVWGRTLSARVDGRVFGVGPTGDAFLGGLVRDGTLDLGAPVPPYSGGGLVVFSLDPAGAPRWLVELTADRVAIDAIRAVDGAVRVIGEASGELRVAGAPVATFTTSVSEDVPFLLELDPDTGAARSAVAFGTERLRPRIARAGCAGKVVVAGDTIGDDQAVGGIPLPNVTGLGDAWVARLDPATGIADWAVPLTTFSSAFAADLACEGTETRVVGTFTAEVVVGGRRLGPGDNITLGYAAVIDDTGRVLDARDYRSTQSSRATGVAMQDGEVAILGYFDADLALGPGLTGDRADLFFDDAVGGALEGGESAVGTQRGDDLEAVPGGFLASGMFSEEVRVRGAAATGTGGVWLAWIEGAEGRALFLLDGVSTSEGSRSLAAYPNGDALVWLVTSSTITLDGESLGPGQFLVRVARARP